MRSRMWMGIGAGLLAVGVSLGPVLAEEETKFVPVEFTQAFLDDPAKVETGKEIWFEQCTHCHGYKAYPGKAPKLKPRRYKPGFVYKRITKGFKKMPAWEDVYDQEERMAITAYVMHKSFSP